MAQLKDLLVEGKSRFIDKIYASDQFISKVVQGTSPFLIDSSTLVSNLNADLLDGVHESSFFRYRGNIDASYVDLTNYAANADGYQNPLNGIYTVQRNNHSCSLITFTGAGSASGLDVYFHYSKGGEFKFRRRIDSNRLSGAWETFITDQNFSSYLGYIGTTAVQASQLDGQNITGIGTILWPGATREILRFSTNNSTWYSGLKYSWSSNTTVALWGKHANTQFVWHAGTDFTANDVNGTSNRGYDFQVGRIDNNLEVRSSGIMNAAAFVEHNSTPTNVFLLKPKSATYITTTSSVTGAITITLPASIGNTMTSMWIDVYLYSTNKSFSVHVGGYTYNNSTWANNPFAMVYGAEWTVRLGHNGTNFIIYIGETNTSWAYPQIAVRDVLCGFQPSSANWEKDFAISFSTSFSNVTAIITNYALTTKNLLLDNVLTLKASAYTADATWTYPGGSYASVKYPNMRLIGDPTYGLSTIEFISQKGDTTINKPTDCAFIQFQPYGVTTQTAIGTQPTLASSGEANRLVIGVNNDSNDSLILQTPATTGLKHAVGTGLYTIWDSGNDGSGSGLDADTVDGIHGTDFVEKRYGRFYPFVKSDSTRSVWHKVTFPHTGYTSTSNAWFMLTMEIVLSGSYQNAAAGKIFLNYYFLKDSSNNWSAVTVKGVAIGTHITSSGVKIRYDIANPAIFYIKVSTYNYTSFAIENLSANDTAQNYDYRNTTIETIAEADIPSAADKYIPIAVIESNDGSTLIATNLTSDVAKRLAQSPISSLSTFTHTTDLIYTARGGGNSITDKPTNVDAFGVITMKTADGWYGQLLMSANSASGIYWRTGTSLSGGWKQLIDTSNYTSYLGYIGTTPVQASSAAQAVTGITALTFNGATSAGTNYITGTAGRIYFGGNFHLDSLGSNATYINYYTGNNVYLVSGSTQGKVGIGTSSPENKLDVNGIASIYQRGNDNTAFKGLLILKQQNSSEGTNDTWSATQPSFGIQFNRFWTSGTSPYGETACAGIFALVTSSWRGGLVFRTKNNTTNGGIHDISALILKPSGAAQFASTVTASKFISTVASGTQPYSCTSTTLNTNLNADLLDDYHVTSLLRKVTVPNNAANDFNTFESMTLTGRGDPTTGASLSNAPWTGAGPAGGYGVLTYLWSGYGTQLAFGYNNNKVYIRNKYYYNSGANWSTTWDSLVLTSEFTTSNITGILPISKGGTGASTAAGARANLGTWTLVNDSYPTLMPADGTTNNWVKIGTSNTGYGIIPSVAGGAGNGHNYIGTSSWYWKYAYIDEIHGTLKGNADSLSGNLLRSAAITTQSAARIIYCKIASFSYGNSGMLLVDIGGNCLVDRVYINYGSGNTTLPVVCGWKDSNSGYVDCIYTVKGSSWNSSWDLWVKINQQTTANINVYQYWGACTVNTAADWSATATEPSYYSKYEVARGMFGDMASLSFISSSAANYVDSAKGRKHSFTVYALTGSAPTPVSGTGPSTGDGFFMVFNYNDSYVTQIAIDLDPTYKLAIRHWKNDASTWRAWKNILTSNDTYVSDGYGTIGGTTITKVNYATSAGSATNSTYASVLRDPTYYTTSTRRTSANITFADAGLHYYLATSSMSAANGKPDSDGHILHMAWDNSKWDAQLTVPTSATGAMQWRVQTNGTDASWSPWKTVIDSSNIGSQSVAYATVASKISDITTSDAASSTATWRRVWFSYDNNVTGRPAYSDNFAYQTSTGTLKVGKLSITGATAYSWLDGQKYGPITLNNATDTGSYWSWIRQTNTGSSKYFSIGVLNNSFYIIGSSTSRTSNGYDYGWRFDISNGWAYGNFQNADTVDNLHASDFARKIVAGTTVAMANASGTITVETNKIIPVTTTGTSAVTFNFTWNSPAACDEAHVIITGSGSSKTITIGNVNSDSTNTKKNNTAIKVTSGGYGEISILYFDSKYFIRAVGN